MLPPRGREDGDPDMKSLSPLPAPHTSAFRQLTLIPILQEWGSGTPLAEATGLQNDRAPARGRRKVARKVLPARQPRGPCRWSLSTGAWARKGFKEHPKTPPLPRWENGRDLNAAPAARWELAGHNTQPRRGDAEIPAGLLRPRRRPQLGRSLKDSPAQNRPLESSSWPAWGQDCAHSQGSEHPAPASKPKTAGFPSPTSAHNPPDSQRLSSQATES